MEASSSFMIDEELNRLSEEIFPTLVQTENYQLPVEEDEDVDSFLHAYLDMAIDHDLSDDIDEDLVMAMLASNNDGPKVNSASQESIKNLEEVKIEEASGLNCVICLDQLPLGTTAKRLPCSHVFHGDCIIEWLRNNNTCPLCRYQMPAATS